MKSKESGNSGNGQDLIIVNKEKDRLGCSESNYVFQRYELWVNNQMKNQWLMVETASIISLFSLLHDIVLFIVDFKV